MKKSDMKIWMRMGDNDDYHDFDNSYEAGYEVGSYLDTAGYKASDVKNIRWQEHGLQVGGFTGMNYISLFWGDDDAQDAKPLSKADKGEFVRGAYEGGDFEEPVRKVSEPKSKRKSKKSGSPSAQLRMMR